MWQLWLSIGDALYGFVSAFFPKAWSRWKSCQNFWKSTLLHLKWWQKSCDFEGVYQSSSTSLPSSPLCLSCVIICLTLTPARALFTSFLQHGLDCYKWKWRNRKSVIIKSFEINQTVQHWDLNYSLGSSSVGFFELLCYGLWFRFHIFFQPNVAAWIVCLLLSRMFKFCLCCLVNFPF